MQAPLHGSFINGCTSPQRQCCHGTGKPWRNASLAGAPSRWKRPHCWQKRCCTPPTNTEGLRLCSWQICMDAYAAGWQQQGIAPSALLNKVEGAFQKTMQGREMLSVLHSHVLSGYRIWGMHTVPMDGWGWGRCVCCVCGGVGGGWCWLLCGACLQHPSSVRCHRPASTPLAAHLIPLVIPAKPAVGGHGEEDEFRKLMLQAVQSGGVLAAMVHLIRRTRHVLAKPCCTL